MAGLTHAVNLFLAHYGLAALFVLLTIEETGVWLPLPGDLLIVYFGYQVVRTPQPLLGAISVLLTVVAATLCGSSLLYLLVRRFRWLLRRFGPLIQLNERRLHRMEGWVQRHGAAAIIPARLVPGLRIPTTIVSGTFGVPLFVFLPAIAASALIWGVVYFVAGAAGRTLLEFGQDVVQAEISEWLLPVIVVVAALATCLHIRRPWRHIDTPRS